MLAMKMNRVSIGYGSPRQALVMTLCIRPCTDRGYSQEKALSMRTGPPSASTNRSSGLAGQPSGMPSSGVFGCTACGPLGGLAQGGIGRGNGALWRKPPGRSMVPSTLIRMARARMVWKPLECAARPRMAWKATGLPVTVSCSRPQVSVQAMGSSIFSSRAVMPISWARRRMVSAGMPVTPEAHSAVYFFSRSTSSWKEVLTGVPSSSLKLPSRKGSAPGAWVVTARSCSRSHHSLFCGSKQPSSTGASLRTNRPNSGEASSMFTSSGALEYCTRKSRS